VGVDSTEGISGKSLAIEGSDDLREDESARWSQVAYSDVKREYRVEGGDLHDEDALSAADPESVAIPVFVTRLEVGDLRLVANEIE